MGFVTLSGIWQGSGQRNQQTQFWSMVNGQVYTSQKFLLVCLLSYVAWVVGLLTVFTSPNSIQHVDVVTSR